MPTISEASDALATQERFESYRRRELEIIKHRRAHTPLRKRWMNVTLRDILEKLWPSCWLVKDEVV